jgi:5-methylthioadenosine/S-adenosylhomocysteine deaminase
MKYMRLRRPRRVILTKALPAGRLLRMAAIKGASAIGLGDDIGLLEVGKRNEIITIDVE